MEIPFRNVDLFAVFDPLGEVDIVEVRVGARAAGGMDRVSNPTAGLQPE
jgi:hypothetical protein